MKKIFIILSAYFCFHQTFARLLGNVPLILNRKIIADHRLRSVTPSTVQGCVELCVLDSDCLSVSFDQLDRTCELYRTNSKTAGSDNITEAKTASNVFLIDSQDWTKGKTNVCRDKPCGPNTMCIPNKNSFHCEQKMNESTLYCPRFDLPEHGMAPNGNTNTPVGRGIALSCEAPYITDLVDDLISYFPTCGKTRKWSSWTYTCYTVTELCIHPILEQVNVTLTASYYPINWSYTDVFFSSTKGWEMAEFSGILPFLKVVLNETYWIGGLSTKGGNCSSSCGVSYSVRHSRTCENDNDMSYILEENSTTPKTFTSTGNVDVEVRHVFTTPLELRCIKLEPQNWTIGSTMRLELLNCFNSTV